MAKPVRTDLYLSYTFGCQKKLNQIHYESILKENSLFL